MSDKEISFEESMATLKVVIDKLESNTSSLDEMVELYEQGINLTNACKKKLIEAENRITTLLKNDNNEFKEISQK